MAGVINSNISYLCTGDKTISLRLLVVCSITGAVYLFRKGGVLKSASTLKECDGWNHGLYIRSGKGGKLVWGRSSMAISGVIVTFITQQPAQIYDMIHHNINLYSL